MTKIVPIAVVASDAPARIKPSNYPEPFASMMNGRVKRPLGDLFGLSNFGVNLTTLPPGTISSLRHARSLQDEFIYVVSGRLTLHTDAGMTELCAGMCAGFAAKESSGARSNKAAKRTVIFLTSSSRRCVP